MTHRDWLERRGLILAPTADMKQTGEYASLLVIAESFGLDSPQMKQAMKEYRNSYAHHIDLDEK